MLYRTLQFLMRQSLKIFYEAIFVEGKEYIQSDVPLLIASTHPNSFLDAIILGTIIDRPIFFLARSDVFQSKWADYILRKMNLIPIYRLQEGHNNLNKNNETFHACFEILEQKGAVLIFAEGISLIDKKVRPPKKGLARIGFGAEDRNDFKLGTQVVPIGINYEAAAEFRNRILVKVEPAIHLAQYKNDYKTNSNAGYQKLNQSIFKDLKNASIITEHEYIYDFLANQISNQTYTFDQLKKLNNQIENLGSTNPVLLKELEENIQLIQDYEKRYNFKTAQASIKENQLLKKLVLIFPAIIGFILNIVPLFIAQKVSDKKVKLIEFYASVRLVLSSILWLLWALFIFLIVLSCNGIWYGFFMIFIMIISGKTYLWFSKALRISKSQRNYKLLQKSTKYEEYKKSLNFIQQLFPDTI